MKIKSLARDRRRFMALVTALAIIVFSASIAWAQPASPPPPESVLSILEITSNSILLELRVAQPQLATVVVDGERFDLVSLPGEQQWTEIVGRPQLPVHNELVGIPDLSTVQIELLDVEETLLPGSFRVYPLPEIIASLPLEPGQRTVDPADPQAGSTESRFAIDRAFYDRDELYPAQIVEASNKGYMRDQLVARLQFNPLRFNPARGELWYAGRILLRLHFDAPQKTMTDANALATAPGPDPLAPRLTSFDEALSSTLLNYQQALSWRIPRNQAPVMASKAIAEADDSADKSANRFRIEVTETGLTEISYAQLAAAGAPVDSIDPANIRMIYRNAEIAIEVLGGSDGRFDPGDSIRFYAEQADSLYTWRNVYWLRFGQVAGKRVVEKRAADSGGQQPVDFLDRVRFEENRYYQSELPRAGFEEDRWYWTFTRFRDRGAIISRTVTMTLGIPSAAPHQATLWPRLRGASSRFLVDPDHYARLYINGQQIGEAFWDGYEEFSGSFQFDGALLKAGANTFTLETPGLPPDISEDVVFLNWLEIEYRQALHAVDDPFWFDIDGSGRQSVKVAGFSGADLLLYDITDPANPLRMTDLAVTGAGGSYQLAFGDELFAETRRYVALTRNQIHSPLAIIADTPSNLRGPAVGADYLVISHADFLPAAQALADYRATTGFKPRVIDVQDIYNEFNHGLLSPLAIRDFLAFAYSNWPDPAPAYVVLLGDGSYDFKNYLGFDAGTYIPPLLDAVDPFLGETATDNGYVAIVGNDRLPDMHLGRLPANSLAEAWTMVNKTIAYETAPEPGNWQHELLFVTDNPDTAGNFPYLSNEVADYLVPTPFQGQKIYYGVNHTDVLNTRSAVRSGIDSGALLVNYVGHASITWWAAEILLGVNDVPSLNNGNRLPVMLPMTCFEGYFHSPIFASLAETLVRAEGKGAVASWSATGQGVATGHDYMHRGFYEAIFNAGVRRLGPATLAGKLKLFSDDYRFRDLIDTYGLLGDPALSLLLPDADLAAQMTVTPEGPVQQGDEITYTIHYSNNGIATVPNGVLTSSVPSNLVNVAISSSNPAIRLRSGDLLIWDLGPLEIGEGGRITITGQVPDSMPMLAAPFSAGSRILSVWRENDLANNKGSPLTVPVLESDVGIGLAFQEKPAAPGGPIMLRIAYFNQGPATATAPLIRLPQPEWLKSPAFDFSGPPPILRTVDPLSWQLPDLAPGQSGVITLTGRLAAEIAAADLPLMAAVEISTPWIDQHPANNNSWSSGPVVFLSDPYEPDNDRSRATRLAIGEVSAGHTHSTPNDVDWFRFPVQAGQGYRMQVLGLSAGEIARLRLFDSAGNLLAVQAGPLQGSDETALFQRAAASDEWFLVVSATSASRPGFRYDFRVDALARPLFLPIVELPRR